MVIAYLIFGTVTGYLAGSLVWCISGSFGMAVLTCMACGFAGVLLVAAARAMTGGSVQRRMQPQSAAIR